MGLLELVCHVDDFCERFSLVGGNSERGTLIIEFLGHSWLFQMIDGLGEKTRAAKTAGFQYQQHGWIGQRNA
jgi:hypothetical protein